MQMAYSGLWCGYSHFKNLSSKGPTESLTRATFRCTQLYDNATTLRLVFTSDGEVSGIRTLFSIDGKVLRF